MPSFLLEIKRGTFPRRARSRWLRADLSVPDPMADMLSIYSVPAGYTVVGLGVRRRRFWRRYVRLADLSPLEYFAHDVT